MRLKSLYLITPTLAANRTRIVIGLVCLIIVDILQLIIPRIIKNAVDDLTLYQAAASELWRDAAAIVGIGLLIGGFRYIWRRNLLGTSRRVEKPCATGSSPMSRPCRRPISTGPPRGI